MKNKFRIIIAVGLLSFHQINATFSRDTIPSSYTNALAKYNELHKESNHQQTAGWLLFGGGAIMGVTGIIVAFNNTAYDISRIPDQQPKDHGNTSKVLIYSGLGLALLSIPFIASGLNNRRKGKLFLKSESPGVNTSVKSNSITSVRVKINF